MPTAAKLVAALCFAAVAFVAAELFKPVLPEGTQVVLFSWINAVLGVIIGWRIMGPRAGSGVVAAIKSGLATSVWLLFWADLSFSMRDMLVRSTKFNYNDPMDAVLAVFGNMVDFFLLAMTPPVVAALVFGGMGAGYLAELASKKWR